MRILRNCSLIVLALLLFAGRASAIVILNSQGTGIGCGAGLLGTSGSSCAPLSVGATSIIVIPPNVNRNNWTIYSETVALRCTLGTYSENAGVLTSPTAPTASAGFYVPAATLVNEKSLVINVYTNGPNAVRDDEPKLEVDCILATGSTATNVDTWEENIR